MFVAWKKLLRILTHTLHVGTWLLTITTRFEQADYTNFGRELVTTSDGKRISNRAALFAVMVAFIVGIIGSLAIRPVHAPAYELSQNQGDKQSARIMAAARGFSNHHAGAGRKPSLFY